jgi:uncharacterized protein with PQ loop repeat
MDSHHLHHLHARKRVHQNLEQYPSANPRIKLLDDILLVVAVIGPLVTIPQIVQVFTTQDVRGLSSITWGLYALFNILWLIYGIVHKEKPLIITYALWLLMNTTMFVSIFIFS